METALKRIPKRILRKVPRKMRSSYNMFVKYA
jgi:hypothetical protein